MQQEQHFYSILFLLFSLNCQGETQNLSELENHAAQYLEAHYSQHAEKVVISVSRLDKRLQLQHCTEAFTFKLRDSTNRGGSVSLKAQCDSAKPWSLYMSAHIALHHRILVASRDMARAEQIGADDMHSVLMDTSVLRHGYITGKNQAIGKQLKRSIGQLEPLRQGLLRTPTAVKRGDTVRLEITSGAMTVAAKATALSNGGIGDRIRVRNNSSERIIQANITAEGQVTAVF